MTAKSPTSVSAKIWKASDAEPSAWQKTASDSLAASSRPVGWGCFATSLRGDQRTDDALLPPVRCHRPQLMYLSERPRLTAVPAGGAVDDRRRSRVARTVVLLAW